MSSKAAQEKTLSKTCMDVLKTLQVYQGNTDKGYPVYAERIENEARSGTPDLYISALGMSCWIELKCAAKKGLTGTINLSHIRKGQIQWHRKYRKGGSESFYLIQLGSGKLAEYFLVKSEHGPELQLGISYATLTAICSARCIGKAGLRNVLEHAIDWNTVISANFSRWASHEFDWLHHHRPD